MYVAGAEFNGKRMSGDVKLPPGTGGRTSVLLVGYSPPTGY